jgi:hypothetical protein
MARLAAWSLLVGTIPIAGGGCSSLRVPAQVPAFPEAELQRTGTGPVELEARAVDARALNWELFDDHLPELGLAPVWVRVRNRGAERLDLGRASWRLELGGRRFSALGRDAILGRFYKRKKIRMYTLQAHAAARTSLDRLLIAAGPLAPGTSASGFVFLGIDPRAAGTWVGGTLVLHGVRLGSRRAPDLTLVLGHAQP